MRLTTKNIESLQSDKGGMMRHITEELGIPSPLPKGWKYMLIGKEVSLEDYSKLLSLRNTPSKGLRKELTERDQFSFDL